MVLISSSWPISLPLVPDGLPDGLPDGRYPKAPLRSCGFPPITTADLPDSLRLLLKTARNEGINDLGPWLIDQPASQHEVNLLSLGQITQLPIITLAVYSTNEANGVGAYLLPCESKALPLKEFPVYDSADLIEKSNLVFYRSSVRLIAD